MQNKLGGPRTEQGKARVSQNALKHGMSSTKMFLLQNESPEQWQQMLAACVEEFGPGNEFEHKLVEEIAYAKWRLRRAWISENAITDIEMEDKAEAFAAKYDRADEGVRQGSAFKSLANDGHALALLMRYETRVERAYKRAIKTLEDVRASRARRNRAKAGKREVASS
jgi:hypothetical protein